MITQTITIHPGTQRSWDRECGVGTAPDWYLEGYEVTYEVNDPIDINTLLKQRAEKATEYGKAPHCR